MVIDPVLDFFWPKSQIQILAVFLSLVSQIHLIMHIMIVLNGLNDVVVISGMFLCIPFLGKFETRASEYFSTLKM